MPPAPDVDERLTANRSQQLAREPADAAIALLAARQWGVVSVHDLRAAGLSDGQIRTRVRRSWLHPLYRGAYAVGHPNPSREGRFLAAVMACGPGARLSHLAAASLCGFYERAVRVPEVTVVGSRAPSHPRIRTHRTVGFDEGEVALWRGVPITSPARTLIDIAPRLSMQELRHAVRRAHALGLVETEELLAAARRWRHRRGVRKLLRIIATASAPTRSVLEDVVLDLMLSGGMAQPDVNVPIVLGGRRVIPDFRWPTERLVVEADGRSWHDNKVAREDDAARQALLEAHGERVVRVTWEQAVARPGETRARLRAAGAPSAP